MERDDQPSTSGTSWTSRLGNALTGILVGVILFLASLLVLTLNENRAVFLSKAAATATAQQEAGDPALVEGVEAKPDSREALTWIFRVAGFALMVAGIRMMAGIFSVCAGRIPFLGRLAGVGLMFLTFAAALPLTLITIALTWMTYRPVVAVPLLLLAGGCSVFAVLKLRTAPRPHTAG